MPKKYFFLSALVYCSLFSFQTIFAAATTTNSVLCNAINSNNIYSKNNLITIQTFLKNTYFPNISVSGVDDSQFRKYVSKYQYAFGLIQTGKLNPETLSALRKKYNCYDIENRIYHFEKYPPIKPISQSEILYNLIMNYFNFPTGSSTPNNNSVGDTSVQVQVANTQSTNSANTNTGPTCTDYLGNIFQEGETADDICDTKQSDSEYKSCISSRRAANIPMICKSGNWLKK